MSLQLKSFGKAQHLQISILFNAKTEYIRREKPNMPQEF